MQRTRSVSFSRDNLIHLVMRQDFFEKNPALVTQQQEITDCVARYKESIAAAGCGCRANTSLVMDCLENLLTKLEALQAAGDEPSKQAVAEFIKYSTNVVPRENEIITLNVYFRKTGVNDAHKYEFVL